MMPVAATAPGGSEQRVSPAVEDFLRALATLGGAESTVTTSRLAAELAIRDPSVTTRAKRLHTLGLVVHTPYHGLRLTPAGERVANDVLRRHDLIETYLATRLGMPGDLVHAEAERLEHHLSDALEAHILAALGGASTPPIPSP